MKRVVLIRGPPGSGKTTLAEKVGKRLKGNYVVLHKDVFNYQIPHRGEYNINPIMHLLAEKFLSMNFSVVIEGLYGGQKVGRRINLLKQLAKRKKATFTLIFLDTSKDVCLKRNRMRKHKIPVKDVHKWYDYLYECNANRGIGINNNHITPQQALKKVMCAINNERNK